MDDWKDRLSHQRCMVGDAKHPAESDPTSFGCSKDHEWRLLAAKGGRDRTRFDPGQVVAWAGSSERQVPAFFAIWGRFGGLRREDRLGDRVCRPDHS